MIPSFNVQCDEEDGAGGGGADIETDREYPPRVVLCWLRLLNAQKYNNDPRKDALIYKNDADYRIAAVSWLKYAARYWPFLCEEILKLFIPASDLRHNFARWVLEWTRHVSSSKPEWQFAASDLLPRLYDGDFTPLHMAAILGIAPLTEELLLVGADVDHIGAYGPPLYCALVGPNVLVHGVRARYSSDVLIDSVDSHRRSTIGHLLDADPDCTFTYEVRSCFNDRPIHPEEPPLRSGKTTLAGLALHVSLSCRDTSIFEHIVGCGGWLDSNFVEILCSLRNDSSDPRRSALGDALNVLLVYGAPPFFRRFWTNEGPFFEAIQEFARDFGVGYKLDPTRIRSDFREAVMSAITGGLTLPLEHFAMDRRFDPNMPVKSDGSAGTIAHLAVSGNHFDIVEMLLAARSDFTRSDDKGRSPLLVAESPKMVELLVLKHRLPSTDTDNDGRNLWHYAMATEDLQLLKWLCENDPAKRINMMATTQEGAMPLHEALYPLPQHETLPSPALMRLLREMKWCEVPAPRDIDLGTVLSWGSLELVDELVAVGVDFGRIDKQGASALHLLNHRATPELVNRLWDLLGDKANVGDAMGRSPAEAILARTFGQYGEDGDDWTMTIPVEPHSVLTRSTFCALLRDEVLDFRNPSGFGMWELVSKLIRNAMKQSEQERWTDEQRLRAICTTGMVLQVLVERGTMRRFEEERRKTPIQVLRHSWRGPSCFGTRDNPYLGFVLRHSEASLRAEFYRSAAGYRLLSEAWKAKNYGLIAAMAETGMSLDTPHKSLRGRSFTQGILLDESPSIVVCLEDLLDSKAKPHILACKHAIYQTLTSGPTPMGQRKMHLLLQKGLDTNPPPSPSGEYYLPQAIARGLYGVATMMLDRGADPLAGREGRNAVMVAARGGDVHLMASVVRAMEGRPGGWEKDALQMAATRGFDRIVLLLQRGTSRGSVGRRSSGNREAPGVIAARIGAEECVDFAAA